MPALSHGHLLTYSSTTSWNFRGFKIHWINSWCYSLPLRFERAPPLRYSCPIGDKGTKVNSNNKIISYKNERRLKIFVAYLADSNNFTIYFQFNNVQCTIYVQFSNLAICRAAGNFDFSLFTCLSRLHVSVHGARRRPCFARNGCHAHASLCCRQYACCQTCCQASEASSHTRREPKELQFQA